MNLKGILDAKGLEPADEAALEELLDVYDGTRARNANLEAYY